MGEKWPVMLILAQKFGWKVTTDEGDQLILRNLKKGLGGGTGGVTTGLKSNRLRDWGVGLGGWPLASKVTGYGTGGVGPTFDNTAPPC